MKKHLIVIGMTLMLLAVGLSGCISPDDEQDVIDDEQDVGFNESPIAEIWATPLSGVAPLKVYFDSYSSDPDGEIVFLIWRYIWIEGGGHNAVIIGGEGSSGELLSTLEKFSYTFNNPGAYNVQLVVRDDKGAYGYKTVYIDVESTW